MPQAGGAPCCPLVLLQGLRLCSYIPNLLQLPECAFCLPSQWLRVLSARLLSSPTFLSLTPGCDTVRWDPAPVGEQPQPAMAVQPRIIPKTPGLCAAGPEHSAGLQHYGTEAEQEYFSFCRSWDLARAHTLVCSQPCLAVCLSLPLNVWLCAGCCTVGLFPDSLGFSTHGCQQLPGMDSCSLVLWFCV